MAYLKPSSLSNKSCILGIGNGLRLIRLFSSRKSEINRTVPSFLGMINVGAAHSEWLIFLSTPNLHRRSIYISNFNVISYDLGIEYGLA